jgi:serine protein kinase
MEKQPIYAIKGSPVNESPLGLFPPEKFGSVLESDYGIPRRYLTGIMSPWAVKRLEEFEGDLSRFRVVRIQPSVLRQVAITKTEPGDDNNQDISSLVGKVDIRQLEHLSQNDPDAYSYSGGLCLANQGLLEFVEMFKAPIKMLHPLLTATQEGNFKGTEGFSAIPFNGVIVAHSNESEWHSFRNNKNNEAFLDRIYIVKVPYCVRVSEEVKIYQKLLTNSSLAGAPCAPGTLEMMAQFSVLTRLKEPENSSIYSKMRVYDGETLKDVDPKAKTLQEYRDYAGTDEGMTGMSTRFAYKILSAVFNHDQAEIAANPVHLMYVLEQRLAREDLPDEVRRRCIEHVKGYLAPRYAELIGKEIQTAYLESYAEYGQNIFDRYVTFADCWIQERTIAIPRPARASTAARSTPSSKRSKSPRASRTRRTSATRSSISCSARVPTTTAATPRGAATRSSASDREEDVLEHRGPLAGDLVQREGLGRREAEAPELRRADGRQGLYREAGPSPRGVVPPRAQVVVGGRA